MGMEHNLLNIKTGRYFAGVDGPKPEWTPDRDKAEIFPNKEAANTVSMAVGLYAELVPLKVKRGEA